MVSPAATERRKGTCAAKNLQGTTILAIGPITEPLDNSAAYDSFVIKSKLTFFVTVYGTCFSTCGVIDFVSEKTPSFFSILYKVTIQPLERFSGLATIRILKASIGQSMIEAANPDTAALTAKASTFEFIKVR